MMHHEFHAGGPMGNWWKNSDTVQKLQLSNQQVQQLEQTFIDHRMRLIDQQAALEKEHLKLQSLMDQDQPREAQVLAQVDQVQAARGRLEKEFTAMSLDFRKILTPDQWRKLQSMRPERGNFFYRQVPPPGAPGPPPQP